MIVIRILAYLWASPATALGLLCAPLAWLSGGHVALVDGVVEIHGGLIKRLLDGGLPVIGSGAAMTLGHVVIGQDQLCLLQSRRHERVHVRQYERWGLAFFPAYLAAGAWQWLRGRRAYWGNPFEVEARQGSGVDAMRE